jgi:tetratricopeptide (TPR) repeat protein
MNKAWFRASVASIFLILVVLFGCESRYSMHELVAIDNHGADRHDIYISFLLDQIDSDPRASANYIKLARIYKQRERSVKAMLLLQRASRATKQDISVMLELGKLYLEAGDAESLSAVLQAVSKVAGEQVDFLKLSAGYSLLRKDYVDAIFFANRAMLLNPYDDESNYFLASAKLINKDSIGAYQSFQEAYSLKQSDKNFAKLYEMSLALKRFGEARKYLMEFERENEALDCCYFWGSYYNRISQKDSARTALLNCAEERFSENRIPLELARAYYPGKTDSVLFYLDHFLSEKPDNMAAIILKAKALERNGFYAQSRTCYETAIKIDSTSALALDGLNNLERKVAYLRLIKRKESVRRDLDTLKSLNSKEIN